MDDGSRQEEEEVDRSYFESMDGPSGSNAESMSQQSNSSQAIMKDYPMPPNGSLNKIRVIVRVRPLLQEEEQMQEIRA